MAIVGIIAPSRLGVDFRRLMASSWLSNLSDGVAVAVGPLLIQSETDNNFLIAAGSLAMFLPWLLFGLLSGALADLVDRRLMVALANVARTAVLSVLVGAIVFGWVNVWVVYAALFVLGSLETMADSAIGTLLPMLVPRADLTAGNARLQFGTVVLNRLAGPPLGAALFVVGRAWPLALQLVLLIFAALVVVRMAGGRRPEIVEVEPIPTQIVVAARWAFAHRVIRTLMITVALFNITYGASRAILVEYSSDHLNLGTQGYGWLLSAGAVGGILGATSYVGVERRVGMATIMRVGLVIEVVYQFVFAATDRPVVAIIMFFVFGIHEAWWATTTNVVRQSAVPESLQGRIGSLYMVVLFSSLVIGILIGGVIATIWTVTTPYWFAGFGSALTLIWLWPKLSALVVRR